MRNDPDSPGYDPGYPPGFDFDLDNLVGLNEQALALDEDIAKFGKHLKGAKS